MSTICDLRNLRAGNNGKPAGRQVRRTLRRRIKQSERARIVAEMATDAISERDYYSTHDGAFAAEKSVRLASAGFYPVLIDKPGGFEMQDWEQPVWDGVRQLRTKETEKE